MYSFTDTSRSLACKSSALSLLKADGALNNRKRLQGLKRMGRYALKPLKRVAREDRGQATVEAAFALPILMVLVLILLQPGIILYDRIVMHGAAAEACRLLTTSSPSSAQSNDDYIRRRLSAIPQIDQFHVHSGGCTWKIETTGNEASGEVSVRISTEVRPLPLLDMGMVLAGLTNAHGNLLVEVNASAQTQPEWIAASSEGTDPSGWVGI